VAKRNDVHVRPARKGDEKLIVAWSVESSGKNLYDPNVILYPSTFTMCAFDSTGPLLYMPVQQPMMMDSVAFRPGLDLGRAGLALKTMFQAVITQGYIKGAGEIYFAASEPTVAAIAERHGFEKFLLPVYRVKISELEKET